MDKRASLPKEELQKLDSLREAYLVGDHKNEQAYLSAILKSISSMSTCFWCKYGNFASDCIPCLFTLPDGNPYTRWFKDATKTCLSNCKECIYEYYQSRRAMIDRLEERARPSVEKALYDFDFERFRIPMIEYLEGKIDHKQPLLIYAIYEIMIYAPWVEDEAISNILGRVIEALVSAKRMLKVSELLPGILYGAVSRNESISAWCMNRLSQGELIRGKSFLQFDFESLIIKSMTHNQALAVAKYSPSTEIKVSKELLDFIWRKVGESSCYLKIFLFLIQSAPFNILSPFIDGCVKRIMRMTIEDQSSILSVKVEAIQNWLESSEQDVFVHGISYLVHLMTEKGQTRATIIESFNRWSTFNQHLGLPLICALCLDYELLSAFSVNVHYITCMYLKALEPWTSHSDQIAMTNQSLLLSKVSRHLILCCIYAIRQQRMLPQYISFTNAYIKSIVNLKLISRNDLLDILKIVGKSLMAEGKVAPGIEFVRYLCEKAFDDTKMIATTELLASYIAFCEVFPSEVLIVHNSQQFLKLLSMPWEKTLLEKTAKIFYAFQSKISFNVIIDNCTTVFKFLSRNEIESSPALYSSLLFLFDSIKNSNNAITNKAETSSCLCLLIQKTAGSIRSNGMIAQTDKVLCSIMKIMTMNRMELSVESKLAISHILRDKLASPAFEIDISDYEKVMNVSLEPLKEEQKSRIVVLSEGPERIRRLVDSMQSKVVPLTNKPLSRLEAIKSEMVRSISSSNVPIKKRRATSMDSVSLATIPSSQKRVAHNSKAEDAETTDDEDEGDLSTVKESLLGKQSEQRSIKVVEIDPSGGFVNPDIARLLPKKNSAETRDFTSWQRLQKHVLGLDLKNLSDGIDGKAEKSQIPTYFKDYKEYQSVFEPLLFLEAEAQIFQSLEDMDKDNQPGEDPVVSITAVNMVDDFHEIDCLSDEKTFRLLSENDVLIAIPSADTNQQILSIVFKSIQRKGMSEIGIRLCMQKSQANFHNHIKVGMKWTVRPVCNLVTSSREHQALAHLSAFGPICEHILIPRYDESAFKESDVESIIPSIMERHALNRPQAYAVANSIVDPNNFTLIQGPPGTGKTRVIESIISTITSKQYSSAMLALVRNRPRIMLCAPSNAAVDEVVRRLILARVNVVRVGSSDLIDESVKTVFLDNLVDKIMQSVLDTFDDRMSEYRVILNDLQNQLLIAEKASIGDVQSIKKKIWTAKESMRKLARDLEDSRSSTRSKVIQDASVVACTLSGAGHDIFSRMHSNNLQFEYVIVDEACQAVEISTLIPLQWGAKKVVLVGDPNQLPPTILSQTAINGAYEQSLFKRLQKANPEQVLLLSVQYRMHPEISQFPSTFYYQSRLVNGPGMAIETSRPWHSVGALGPYRFFDVPGQEEKRILANGVSSKSTLNVTEAQMVVQLVAFLCQQFPDYSFKQKIGIVTPYREQKKKIQRELMRQFGNDSQQLKRLIDVSTVDGFQGQESEIIIFSCVRTGQNRGVGFLSDARRMNVALTRAKSSLFVLGRAESLRRHALWRALIDDAKSRGVLVPYDEEVWNEMKRVCAPLAGKIPGNLLK